MTGGWLIIDMVVGLTLLLTACAPKIETAPQTALAVPDVIPTFRVPAPTMTSPVEADWSKVIEAAKKEGKVTAYSFTWVGDIGLAVEKAFESRYGISMEILTGSASEFTERLKTERRMGQRVGDMTEGSSSLLNNMKIEGLMISVAAELPALREKDVWWFYPTFLDPEDKANLGWRYVVDSPWINTNLIKPGEEPSSWKDLLQPRWKGNIGMREPKFNAGIISSFVAFLDKGVWDENYIIGLHRQGLRYIVSTAEEMRHLSAGEIPLTAMGSGATGPQFVAQGASIRAISMKEGDSVILHTIAALANAPHPNATKVLLNWLLSPEGQTVAGKAQGNSMVRKDVPDFRPLAVRTEMANPIIITQKHVDEGTKRFRDRWFDKLVGR